MDGLKKLQKRYPKTIGDVRGKGLMIGVELVVDEQHGDRTPNPQFMARSSRRPRSAALVGKGGMFGNVFRIAPPLSVTTDEVDEALSKIGESFAAASS
jgi:4-aminobutyrate aminotransferase-like enzyme